MRRVAFRALTFAPSTPISISTRRFSSLLDRAPAVSVYKPYTSRLQRRWLADEAAATQSEPVTDGEEAVQHSDAENSIASSSEPADDGFSTAAPAAPPQDELEAQVSAAEAPTTGESVEVPNQVEPDSENPSVLDNIAATAKSVGEAAGAAVSGGQNKKSIYVGNLFFDVRGEDLKKEFSRAGEVLHAKVIVDGRGLSKGFGYVDFATEEEAAKAISLYNFQNFEGRRLSVQYANARGARPSFRDPLSRQHDRKDTTPKEPTKTLFIGNMSFDMSDRDLNSLFREVKNVTDVRVAIDRRTGQPRGFAHADFRAVEDAKKAMEELRGKVVCGRSLRVDYSHSTGRATL